MNKKNNLLVSISLIVIFSLVLVGLNKVLGPVIEKNNASSAFEPLFEVMENAKDFEVVYDVNDNDGTYDNVKESLEAVYSETSGLGYVVKLTTNKGYTKQDIKITVAIDSEGKISGVKLNEYPETKDFGKEYPTTYIGQDSTLADVNLVAGCTFSSSAFKGAIEDAFAFLTTNNLIKEAQKSAEQILLEQLPTVFSGIANPSGILQTEEIDVSASANFVSGYKALNGSGSAYIAKEKNDTYLVIVNASDSAKVYDASLNLVENAVLVDEAITYNSAVKEVVAEAKVNKLIALASASSANQIALENSFTAVVAAYELDNNYGFIVKPYGYANETMYVYVVLDADGKLVKISADEIILHSEYFSAYTLDEASYKEGFVGLDKDTYTNEVSLITGATMSADAMDQAVNAAYDTFAGIK